MPKVGELWQLTKSYDLDAYIYWDENGGRELTPKEYYSVHPRTNHPPEIVTIKEVKDSVIVLIVDVQSTNYWVETPGFHVKILSETTMGWLPDFDPREWKEYFQFLEKPEDIRK